MPVVGADAVEDVPEVNTGDDVGVVAGCPVVTATEKNHRLSTYILTHAYINKKQFRFHLLIKMSICPPLMKLKYYICKREHVLYSCTVKIPNYMEVVLLVI